MQTSASVFNNNGHVGTCVFPFTYGGGDITYTSCAEVKGYGGVGWCAFDARNGDTGSRWGYCTEKCPKSNNSNLK